MLEFLALAQTCAPTVHADTLRRIVAIESAFNPNAIGVVGARLTRQPQSKAEAVATAYALQSAGHNFSVGLAQLNRQHFQRLGLTLNDAFEPCANLKAGATVLAECFARARHRDEQSALRAAFSCYYSGNFRTGFDHGYVQKVVAVDTTHHPIRPVVPKLISSPIDRLAPRVIEHRTSASKASKRRAESVESAAPATDATSTDTRSALIF